MTLPLDYADLPVGQRHIGPARKAQARAVALAYEGRGRHGASAPTVRAKGQGAIAEEIIRRARAAGVFVHESPELVSLLMEVDLDRQIPPQLYVAVAELLAWIYRIEGAGASPQRPIAPRPATPQRPALHLLGAPQ